MWMMLMVLNLCVQDAATVIKARLALYSQSINFNVMAFSGKVI